MNVNRQAGMIESVKVLLAILKLILYKLQCMMALSEASVTVAEQRGNWIDGY